MRRLLVLQLCRFGDILQTTPMLRGLRRHQSDTHVTLVLHDAFRHVPIPSSLYDDLAILPYDDVAVAISENPDAWPAAVRRLESFVATLGPEPFDLALNLTHSDLSSLLMAAIPSREVRGGLVAPDRTRVVRGEVMTYFWASQLSRAQGCFNLVDLHNWTAGVPSERLGLEVEIPDDARRRVNQWLAHRELGGRPIIVVQLGASDDRKRWPAERFGEAIDLLEPELGDVVLVGTETERPLCARAMTRIGRPIHDGFGEFSIVELAALLEPAALLLTNDTGTMHVATAVDTRVVDLSTGPVFAHETGPYGEGHLVIEPQMSCFPCAAGSDCHHLECRDSFSPADIAALVRYALGRGPQPRPVAARILEGHFRTSGRLEYRPIWSPSTQVQDVVRRVSAEVWEPTLLPVEDSASTLSPEPAWQCVPTDPLLATCAALERVASRADRAAMLTVGLGAVDPASQTARMAQVTQELDALRLEAELDPACHSVVSYLRVRLDSCTETDVARLSRTYTRECDRTAWRARALADGLKAAIGAREAAAV